MLKKMNSISLSLASMLLSQQIYAGPVSSKNDNPPGYEQLADNSVTEEAQEIDDSGNQLHFEHGEYHWPDSIYEESKDMADASFLVYTFAYLLSVARDAGLEGIDLNEKGEVLQKEFTPEEVSQIIHNNSEVLQKYFAREFGESGKVEESLNRLQARVSKSNLNRPLTLQHFDDQHQKHEMVYGIAKDDINKRITVVFRGTESALAFKSNWLTNFSIMKKFVPLPPESKGQIFKKDGIWIHSGFHNYMFEKTFDDSDDPNLRKYDEVMAHVKTLLEENPDYRVYVTGHSLGGALSSLAAFFMASDPQINKPVSCISFAAPRIGDKNYLKACQELEKSGKLRQCRVVNDKDSIPMAPVFNYYHAGFQVRLFNDPSTKPEVTYPKHKDSRYNRFKRSWANSIILSFNLSYDHGDYRERIKENKDALKKQSLNDLYKDSDLTGL